MRLSHPTGNERLERAPANGVGRQRLTKRAAVVSATVAVGAFALLAAVTPAGASAGLQGIPSSVAVAGNHVYWTDSFGGAIGRADLDGSNVNQGFITTGANQAVDLAVDGGHIYWMDERPGQPHGTIGRANLDGSNLDQSFITTAGHDPYGGLAVDGGHIYWTNHYWSNQHTIGRANLDGTGIDQDFINAPNGAEGLAVDANHIYWSTGYIGWIARADLDGANVDPTFVETGSDTEGLAVDADHLYWSDATYVHPIGRADLDGTNVKVGFIGDTDSNGLGIQSTDVAVDAGHLYWGNSAYGGIRSIGRANLDGSNPDVRFIAPQEVAAVPLLRAQETNLSNLEAGGKRFIEYGFTYGFGPRQPVTSYLDDPNPDKLAEIDRQMAQARGLGANTLRIRIQPRQILTSPTSFNQAGLAALRDLLEVAEENRVYLDITGLFAGDLDKSPAWYDALDTASRWRAQANFWNAVSSAGSASSSVLVYELATEPIVPAQPVPSWYMTDPGIHYPMPQYLVKDPGGQSPIDLARRWITKMKAAVRLHDSQHLISVGMLPVASSAFSFAPANVGAYLDTVTPHIYPRSGAVDAAVDTARRFAATRKPVTLGETYSLHAGYATVQDFILQASRYFDGYLSFYDGRTAAEARADGDSASINYAKALEGFASLRPTLCSNGRCQLGAASSP